MSTPKIPKGWRKLVEGEQIARGDRFWFAEKGPWKVAHHYKLVPNLYYHDDPITGHVLHIRRKAPRSLARAKERK